MGEQQGSFIIGVLGGIDPTSESQAMSLSKSRPEAGPGEDGAGRAVGFALGGLGGGNAFGAGFLAAARERRIRPSAISCTSGMIVWTAHFLAGDDLREKLREHLAEMPKAPESVPFGN